MTRHPLDATALIFGLLFTLSGIAIISDAAWPDIDTTAVVGATTGVIGLAFVTVLVLRQLREGSQPPPLSDPITIDSTGAASEVVTDDQSVISD